MGDIKLSEGDLNSTAGHRDLSGRSHAVRVNRARSRASRDSLAKGPEGDQEGSCPALRQGVSRAQGLHRHLSEDERLQLRCAVRWRYGQFVYKGKIKLALRSDGRIASKFVLRKTIP